MAVGQMTGNVSCTQTFGWGKPLHHAETRYFIRFVNLSKGETRLVLIEDRLRKYLSDAVRRVSDCSVPSDEGSGKIERLEKPAVSVSNEVV